MKADPVTVKIIVTDAYLSFEHKLWNGTECIAIPQYTSTKKLKGYSVKSKTKGTDIYLRVDEIELLNPSPSDTHKSDQPKQE